MKRVKSFIALILAVMMFGTFAGCDAIVGIFGRGPVIGSSDVPDADLSNIPEIEGIDFAYEIAKKLVGESEPQRVKISLQCK